MSGMETNSPVPNTGGSEQYDYSHGLIALTGNNRDKTESFNTGWKIFISNISNAS